MKDYRVTDFDDIHCDFSRIDGTERPMLSLACSRDDGKTTGFLIRKALPAFRRGHPTILLFRNQVDVSESSIRYFANLMNRHVRPHIEGDVVGSSKTGLATFLVDKKPLFHCVPIGMKEYNLKKTAYENAEFALFDELEVNPQNKEKYLVNEYEKFLAFYDTQRKVYNTRFYFLTNMYSRVNPYWRAWGINPRQIELGCFLKGDYWAFEWRRMNPLLVDKLKRENQHWDEETSYGKMAFANRPPMDEGTHVGPMPNGYALSECFRYEGDTYGAYLTSDWTGSNPLYYFKRERDNSRRRVVYAFDFADLMCNAVIADRRERNHFAHIKRAIREQDYLCDSLETEFAFRSIFEYL